MAAMEILRNRNYCVELLDEMISYFSKSENILAQNIIILLSSIDIIFVSRLWSIMHISIFIPMCWLVSCTQKMK